MDLNFQLFWPPRSAVVYGKKCMYHVIMYAVVPFFKDLFFQSEKNKKISHRVKSNQSGTFLVALRFHCTLRNALSPKNLGERKVVKDERSLTNDVFSCPVVLPFSGRRNPREEIPHRNIVH